MFVTRKSVSLTGHGLVELDGLAGGGRMVGQGCAVEVQPLLEYGNRGYIKPSGEKSGWWQVYERIEARVGNSQAQGHF